MPLGGIDLNLLLVLQALLEECNVTRAAIRVGVPQPAVSNALARLRRHYRDELLVRSGNGYALTPLARSLLPSVQESVRLIGDAFSPQSGPDQPRRTFTISVSDWSLMLLGASLLRRVRELAPDVTLRVERITQDMRQDDTWVHQHDLLIAPVGFYRPASECMVLCRDRFVCVLDPGNPRLRDGQLSLADFAALPHATAQLPHAVADPVRLALDRLGVRPAIAIVTAAWLPLPFLVAGTDMVAVVPERLARRMSETTGVAVAEPPFGAVEVVEAAWWHPLRATDPSHAWLRAVLTETALLNDASQLAVPCSRSGSLFTYVNKESLGMLDGILFFPVTPFGTDGAVDTGILADHLRGGLTAGPGAIFAACGTGEFHALAPEEYESVVRTAVTEAAHRVPVFAGAGGPLPVAVRLARLAADAGADGLLVMPPYLVDAPPAGLIEYVRAIASATSLQVIVYQRANARFDPASAAAVAELPTVVGFKDGLGDVDLMAQIVLEVRRAVAGKDFQFFNGLPTAEVTVPAYRGIGVPLYSSAAFCFAPEVAVAFHRALSSGDAVVVDQLLSTFFHPLTRLRRRVPGYAVSLVKAGVRLRGLPVGGVRAPLIDPSPADLSSLESIIDAGLGAL